MTTRFFLYSSLILSGSFLVALLWPWESTMIVPIWGHNGFFFCLCLFVFVCSLIIYIHCYLYKRLINKKSLLPKILNTIMSLMLISSLIVFAMNGIRNAMLSSTFEYVALINGNKIKDSTICGRPTENRTYLIGSHEKINFSAKSKAHLLCPVSSGIYKQQLISLV